MSRAFYPSQSARTLRPLNLVMSALTYTIALTLTPPAAIAAPRGQIKAKELYFIEKRDQDQTTSAAADQTQQNEERFEFEFDNRLQIYKTKKRAAIAPAGRSSSDRSSPGGSSSKDSSSPAGKESAVSGSSSSGRTETAPASRTPSAASAPVEWSLKTHFNARATSLEESAQEQYHFDPTNIYFEYTKKNFFAQIGFFTLKWEGTDGINPMDIASMKNWSDPLDSRTRASAGVHFGDSTQNWEWEAAYIPLQTSSHIPGDGSQWWPRADSLPVRSDDIELRLPDTVEYNVRPRGEMNDAREHNYAFRIQTHRDFGDIALAYYEGAAQTPLVVPTLNVVPISVSPKTIYLLQSPIELTPSDYRVRSTAAYISAPVESYIFRVASRYDQPLGEARDFTTWTSQTVAGVEKSSELFGHPFIVILQGLLLHSPDGGSLVSIQDAFDKSIIVGMRLQPSDNWTIVLSDIQSTHDSSTFISADATRSFESGWNIKGAVQVIDGPKNTLLGVLDRNDRVTLEVSRNF